MIKWDLVLVLLEILLAIGLWIMADVAVKYESAKWKLLYLLPMLGAWLFLWLVDWDPAMSPVYLAGIVMAAGFIWEKKAMRKGFCAAGCALALIGAAVCLSWSGYRTPDFVKDFEIGFQGMKQYYCLTEHKQIDWDALYEKYLPKFQQADARHDKAENLICWQQFAGEFYDAHVAFLSYEEEPAKEARRRALGRDYGLSLARLSDGRIVAVNVSDGVKEIGLLNGCEVTGWDHVSPDDLTERVDYQIFSSPDRENEAFYKILYVAGMGGDSVTVDFLDAQGQTRQAVLPAVGDYCDRLEETLEILDQGVNIGTLKWMELSEDTVLFRVKNMSYDTVSYQNGDFSGLKSEMEEKLAEYREAGKTRLVMDLRSNGGGNPFMILAMAELLGTEGEHFYVQNALLDPKTCEYLKDPATGKFLTDGRITYRGRGLWNHGEILILVNGQCVSAGDHFTEMMSEMDNVTIVGMTKSNSSGQAVRYIETESGILNFSAIPTLDENGDIYIDTGADHISKIPLDVKVELDENAVRVLFDEGGDYVLQYALKLDRE